VKNASKIAVRGKQFIAYDDPETVYQKVSIVTNTAEAPQIINQFVVCFATPLTLFLFTDDVCDGEGSGRRHVLDD
jgi:hypothetical protein